MTPFWSFLIRNIQVGGQSGLNITNSLAQATLIPVGVNINTLTFYLPELTITGKRGPESS